MIPRPPFRLPPEQSSAMDRACRLEGWTLVWMSTIIGVIYLTMGSSQAMKAAWIEDLLSLVPPIAFLIAAKVRERDPDERFLFGYHEAMTVSFLVASMALFFLGGYILYDSIMALVLREHPTIGAITLFGHSLWLGWLMIAALIYSAVPPVILGRMKLPLSRKLYDKTLYADANMNKADWMTAVAGIFGIVGISLGWWWADSVAALIISVDVFTDGLKHMRMVTSDLMDQAPTQVDRERVDQQVVDDMRNALLALPWVRNAGVRLRDEGHMITGDALVVPIDDQDPIARTNEAERATEVDWRVHGVGVSLVRDLEERR